MMKNLRMLCLGLAAATITAGFAQAENVTSKLKNADMEQGIKHWGIEGVSNIWGKNTKTHSSAYKTRIGYHGMNEGVLENWKGSIAEGLADNEITQTVKNLPNGTYVFGAYIGASKQDSVLNREEVVGVTLFANDATVPVATENPDKGLKNTHTAKFNVAVKVTDGTLNVGLRAESTNANYLVWDNATLYYFGDKDEAAALDEMAKIDLAGVAAIADTIMPYKMQVDSLAYLNEAYAAAKTVTTAAAAWDASEELYWAIFKAHSSLGDYRSFNNAIKNAKKIAGMEWSAVVAPNVAALETLITQAEATYEAAVADRAELNAAKKDLNEAAAYVELDSAYTKIDIYDPIISDIDPGEGVGEYSAAMKKRMEDLMEEIGEVLAEADNGLSAVTAKHRCDSLYSLIDDVLANPISFDAFPITIGRNAENVGGYKVLQGAALDSTNTVAYTSKTYRFEYPLTKVRFIIKETGNGIPSSGKGDGLNGGYPFVTLSAFEMYDEDGNEIELSESDITSNACHNTLNPNGLDGQGIPGLIDDDPNTFFHSTWGVTVSEYHYLEVTLPEGKYNAFSFKMRARSKSHHHQFPAILEIDHVSDAVSNLMSTIGTAKGMNPYQGTAPGFYNADLSAFYAALEAAEALVGTNASEADIMAAIGALEEQMTALDEMNTVMPEPGKKYQIISAGPFFAKQGVNKALTVHSDTTKLNWIWWETAAPDSAQQYFSFEYIENEEGKNYYKMKHEATGLYVGTLLDTYGEEVSNSAGLNAEPDTVELQSLGFGQFGIVHNGMFHTGDHHEGVITTGTPVYGCSDHGVIGDKSGICKWTTAAYNGSAWYIREMSTLPAATKSISELNFKSETINLYEGVNTLTLTADKDCAFSDLVVYGLLGEVIGSSVTSNGAVATVVLDSALIESFSFAFTNAEGVATVNVDGTVSKLSLLQSVYDEAVAVNPTPGVEVMQYKDLTAYNAALDAAEALLLNGGSNEEVEAVIAAIEAAVEGLVPNMPDPDKTYYIVSAVDAFEENHGVKMMLYATAEGEPRWMYENPYKPNRMWKFEAGPEATDEKPAMYYVKNVGLDAYLGSTPSALSEQASPYAITSLGSGQIALDMDNQGTNSGRIHANGHSNGAGKGSNIVYWGSGINTASAWYIFESEAYLADIDFTQFDEEANEYVAPAVKGIYDLFGRRIEVPATTGIYIVDGKKKVIKK